MTSRLSFELIDDVTLRTRSDVDRYLDASTLEAFERTNQLRSRRPERTVLLLPGIFGSTLVDHAGFADDLLWIDPFELVLGTGLDRLRLGASGTRILPGRPLRVIYDPLRLDLMLQANARVEPIAFDWRRSIDDLAHDLHRRVEELARGDDSRTFDVVAHSMGSLVAVRYAQLHGREAARRLANAVFLGPPLRGSFEPVRAMLGTHPLLERFGLVAPQLVDTLRRTLAAMPGLTDLLPDPDLFDTAGPLFESGTWPAGIASRSQLVKSAKTKEALRVVPEFLLERTNIILGCDRSTAVAATYTDGRITGLEEGGGDGTVPVTSAFSDGARSVWQTDADHTAMPLSPRVRSAVSYLLLTGGRSAGSLERVTTLPAPTRLQRSAAVTNRAAGIHRSFGDGAVEGFDVLWLLGVTIPRDEVAPDDALRVTSAARSLREPAVPEEPERLLSEEDLADLIEGFAPELNRTFDTHRSLRARTDPSPLGFDFNYEGFTKYLAKKVLEELDYRVEDPAEPPSIDVIRFQRIRTLFKQHPKAVSKLIGWVVKLAAPEETLSKADYEEVTKDLMGLLDADDPQKFLRDLHGQRFEAGRLGPNSFPGQIDEIPASTGEHRFETIRDALGWFIHTAGPAIDHHYGAAHLHRAPFRTDRPVDFPLVYPEGGPLKILLFSDYPTGTFPTLYMARAMTSLELPYAIHLGDIYYAGRRSEMRAFLADPLEELIKKTDLYLVAGNHEMYAGGHAYLEYLDEKRAKYPELQRQQAPYFRLATDRFNLVAVDTDWEKHGRVSDAQRKWLAGRLREGREAGRVNILFTSCQPLDYDKRKTNKLYDDLRHLTEEGLIGMWFWGNVHYHARFRWAPETNFTGACIGHGGYPFPRMSSQDFAWGGSIDTDPLFSPETGIKTDRGRIGFCVLELHREGDVLFTLERRDWLGNVLGRTNYFWNQSREWIDLAEV